MFVDGKFVKAASGKTFPVYNPATGEVMAHVPEAEAVDVDRAVRAARKAFDEGPWPKMSPSARGKLIWKLGDLLEQHLEEFAEIESMDNGKPLAVARVADVPLAVDLFRYMAGWSTKIMGSTFPIGFPGEYLSYTLREPIGVVGQIIPWNFPLLMAAWKLGPALAAGNTIVLKLAEQTPLSGLKLAELIHEAGFPNGVVNVLTGFGEAAGAPLAAHDMVDKIAFTGSTEVGRLIVKAAAGNLKRLTLELGGKSPLIMFDDANLDKAIMNAGLGLLAGSGQNCSCTSRIYVQRGIYDQVVDGLVAFAKMLPMGGSDDPDSVLGPLISEKQRQRVAGIVDQGVAAGAQVVTGGKPMDRRGFFYEATIVTNTTPDMRLIREEIFGPVGCVIPFDEEEEALAAANDTEYGLAGAIWTENLGRAHRVANELRAGQVWVNCALGADPSMPICGHKQSGWGGERGRKGIEAYFNTKAVYISH